MWMHEHYMWGFWWIFPLLGTAFVAVVLILLIRAIGGGGSRKEIEELRQEIRDLKMEIEKVKKQGSHGDDGAARGNWDGK